MENSEIEAMIREYFDAMENRDLDKCVGFYQEDATIKFQTGIFQGRQAIVDWHKDRFKADLRILGIDKIRAEKDNVRVDGVVTSKRLKAWKIKKISGKVNFTFENGKIKRSEFGMRIYNPLEGW